MITKKIYIGQTVGSLSNRWASHCTPKSSCRRLSRSIAKHGKENFKVEIICRCYSIEEMNHREQYYIRLFRSMSPNGYNLMTGGSNSKSSLETTRKRVASLKKHWESHSRPSVSLETRQKISKATKGVKRSEETRRRMGVKSRVPVYQYSMSGIFIQEFSSSSTAKKELGIGNEEIGKVCRGKKRSAGGYQWRFFKTEDIGEVRPRASYVRGIILKSKHFVKIEKIDLLGNLIKTYATATEASKENNISASHLLKNAKGKKRPIQGFIFRIA